MKICCFFELTGNNNMNFISTVHDFDASSSCVKPSIFSEDATEMDCFKTMLHDHIVDVFTTETSRYEHQVISKYDKDDLPHSLKK